MLQAHPNTKHNCNTVPNTTLKKLLQSQTWEICSPLTPYIYNGLARLDRSHPLL